eukprot:Hpha_TRINITY_DN6627_c0_g1::TRINITY_DN6627_c0_g1_i1::g.26503::m.26503
MPFPGSPTSPRSAQSGSPTRRRGPSFSNPFVPQEAKRGEWFAKGGQSQGQWFGKQADGGSPVGSPGREKKSRKVALKPSEKAGLKRKSVGGLGPVLDAARRRSFGKDLLPDHSFAGSCRRRTGQRLEGMALDQNEQGAEAEAVELKAKNYWSRLAAQIKRGEFREGGTLSP